MRSKPQILQIIELLSRGNTLTTKSALIDYDIYSLSSRISEIQRKRLFPIRKTRHINNGKMITHYSMGKD